MSVATIKRISSSGNFGMNHSEDKTTSMAVIVIVAALAMLD
jgi:hypothetical protein